MANAREKTAWMWVSGEDLRGLSLDKDEQTLTWIWQAGCHCADEDEIVQPVVQFQREGPPGLMGIVPDDVVDELQRALGSAH